VSRKGFVSEPGGLPQLCLYEPFALSIEDKFLVVDQSDSMRGREGLGSASDEVNMGTLLKNQARGLNGIAKALNACDASGFHPSSVHEESVELHSPIGSEKAACSRVESGILFQSSDRGFNGVKSGTFAGEDRIPGFERFPNAKFVRGRFGCRDGPGTSVHKQSGDV
jgi:hypothetical protein